MGLGLGAALQGGVSAGLAPLTGAIQGMQMRNRMRAMDHQMAMDEAQEERQAAIFDFENSDAARAAQMSEWEMTAASNKFGLKIANLLNEAGATGDYSKVEAAMDDIKTAAAGDQAKVSLEQKFDESLVENQPVGAQEARKQAMEEAQYGLPSGGVAQWFKNQNKINAAGKAALDRSVSESMEASRPWMEGPNSVRSILDRHSGPVGLLGYDPHYDPHRGVYALRPDILSRVSVFDRVFGRGRAPQTHPLDLGAPHPSNVELDRLMREVGSIR